MSMDNPDTKAFEEDFRLLLSSVQMSSIQPVMLHSERRDSAPAGEVELNLSWSQAFATDDPVEQGETTLFFRPRYQVELKYGDKVLFAHETIIGIAFVIVDRPTYLRAWANDAARKVFMEKQIQKTLWPFLRQQAMEGMSKLGIPAVPLPWIID
ncbi:MAG: hypothetical protein WCQ50_22145 [Spirochaetota bacterium]